MSLDVQGAAFGCARFSGRALFRSASLVLSFIVPVLAAHAQSQPTSSPEDEYKKLIKVTEDIEPLGDTPFGERISLYDGTLSFEQTDITAAGRGPAITIGRVFRTHTADEQRDYQKRAFGDWDIDIPMITTTTPIASGIRVGWLVNSTNKKTICTNFREPPSVPGIGGDASRADWEPASWWQGYQMRIPGKGSQELLKRSADNTAQPAGTYPIVTKQNWVVGCLAQTVNDATTQGFLALGPDGTKYYFNRLTYRSMPGVSRPTNSGPGFAAARTDGMMSPMAAVSDMLNREEARMLVTRIEDRFGSAINYTYDAADHLTNIDTDPASDEPRHVVVAYNGDRISSITVQGGAAGNRVWQYAYSQNGTLSQLATVTQPDQSTWSFNLTNFNNNFVDLRESAGTCDAIGTPANLGLSYTSTMTHPSGLTASFTVTPVKRGRSYVFRDCKAGTNTPASPSAPGTFANTPNASYSMAITQKQFTGAAIGTQTWQYSYSPSNESWTVNCGGGCATSVWTRVLYPDGHAERSTFSNRYDYTESLLLSEEVFDGEADVTRRRRLTQYGYVNPTAGADARANDYPRLWGNAPAKRLNFAQVESQIPMASRVTQIGDNQNPDDVRPEDQFVWNVVKFDGFARPKDVQRYNNFGYGVEELTELKDDYAHWVLGLPLKVTNVTTGEVVSAYDYDPISITPSQRYRFGHPVMSYTFDGYGQLASFTDRNSKTTSLSNYKRGIPRSISYPDTYSQSIAVDDLGQISSITDQVGATTSYGYDAIGRLARIDFPAGDAVAWAPRLFQYNFVGSARGVTGSHWIRTITQGNKVQRTDFDAMLRPVATGTARASDMALFISSRTDYDWKGRKTFASYPVDGDVALPGISAGVATVYDVLGRPVRQVQTSELGNLTTTTDYFSGGAHRVTDPKGLGTTTWYQAFDEPSFDRMVKVKAPENVLQTVTRDVFGNPLAMTQAGAGQSVTKTMVYDSDHRLCRTWEPESGSEIMAYDDADNVIWSVAGATVSGDGCGREQVVENTKTTRLYDAMNRVVSIGYPVGTAPSTFTYDPRGNPGTATSGNVSWTFGRNKLGLLTAEVLSLPTQSWALGYGYDPNGALSTILYPDGDVVSYNPDALGRPTSAGAYANGATYSPDGDLKSLSLSNGALYSADKNARNLVKNFTFGKGGALLISEDYTYDANGNLSAICDLAGSSVTCDPASGNRRSKAMSYDGMNRLLTATANLWGTESYTYDTLNNIRSITSGGVTNTYNYDARNVLTSITAGGSTLHAFDYDTRGNISAKDGQPFNFDIANRLVSIPDKQSSFVYDASGRRVAKVTPAATTYYAYNSAGQLMWEMDPATRLGSEYVYLGKRLIAKATENVDILKPSQVRTAITIVGVPKRSLDGATIDVTLDIANTGTRTLTANSQYPVQMGYHLIDDTNAPVQAEPGVNIPSDIPAGGHGVMTMHVAAPAVLGTGKRIRFSLVQSGVAWFQDWPGNTTVDAGPYSACPAVGTSNLCNNTTGLIRDQVSVVLTITAGPTLSADGQSVLTTVDIANNGKVTLASAQPHPVNLGNHILDSAGTIVQGDVTRSGIPEIAPGQHAAVTISTPAALLLGNGRRVQFEPVQEGIAWFQSFGATPVNAGPYVTIGGATSSTNGSYALSWQPIAGATSYNLRESLNGGAWTTVSASSTPSWSASGRATGSYGYQVQACGSAGCAPFGPSWTVSVLLPPPVPAAATASAPVAGPVTLSWSASATATRYVVLQQFNGGAWSGVYDGGSTSGAFATPASGTYQYQVQACNSSGCSGYRISNAVAITVPPGSAPSVNGGGTNNTGAYSIGWNGVAGATSYNVFENVNGGGWTYIGNTASGIWSLGGKVPGSYAYAVSACNAGGCGPWSGQVVVTVALLPPTPGMPSVTSSGPSYKPVVRVSWSAVAYATTYEVQETQQSGYAETVGGGADTSWSSLRFYSGSLTYRVRACNAVGCSAWGPGKSITLVSGG